jgi:hypothetical protein
MGSVGGEHDRRARRVKKNRVLETRASDCDRTPIPHASSIACLPPSRFYPPKTKTKTKTKTKDKDKDQDKDKDKDKD